jgi:hypothetical protein
MPAKLAVGAIALLLLIPVLLGNAVHATMLALFGDTPDAMINCATPIADIPPDYCAHYITAATVCPGLHWSILAAIGDLESDHGRSRLPGVADGTENHAGAGGPMQFLAPTFDDVIARHQLPPGGAVPPSRYNPHDAIHAAAYYLCDSGARRGDLPAAVFAYNHAHWYVDMVLQQAAKYAHAAVTSVGDGDCNAIQAANAVTLAAIGYACSQRGLPYVWGGDGAAEGGFDCSGLTKAAYAAAGITLPRTAHTQYHAGPRVSPEQPLLPGDLVFYGTAADVHHVGLYLGSGNMLHAPTFDQPVQIDPYRWHGDDYLGATRPANSEPM